METTQAIVLRHERSRKRITSESFKSLQRMGESTLFDQHWSDLLKARIPCLFLKCVDVGQVVHVLSLITGNTKLPVYIYYRAHGFVDTQHRRPIAETRDFEAALAYAKKSFSQKVRKLFVFAELPAIDESKEMMQALLISIQHAALHHRSLILISTHPPSSSLYDHVTTIQVDYNTNGIQLPFDAKRKKSKASAEPQPSAQPLAPTKHEQQETAIRNEIIARTKTKRKAPIAGLERLCYEGDKQAGSRFGGLCQWLDKKRLYFKAKNLRSPRGLMLIGTPGVNWEFAVKLIAGTWKTTLYRVNLLAIELMDPKDAVDHVNSVLGFLDMAEPCIAWIDHLEEALQLDDLQQAGKSSRLLVDLLYWFEKRSSKVFVVLTVEDTEQIPQEIFKMGHFDEMFYLTLPGVQERADTIVQQVNHLQVNAPSPACLEALVALSNGMLVEEITHTIETISTPLRNQSEQRDIDLLYEKQFKEHLKGEHSKTP